MITRFILFGGLDVFHEPALVRLELAQLVVPLYRVNDSRLVTFGLSILEDFVALDERGLGEAVVSNRFLDHVYARPADASNSGSDHQL